MVLVQTSSVVAFKMMARITVVRRFKGIGAISKVDHRADNLILRVTSVIANVSLSPGLLYCTHNLAAGFSRMRDTRG